MQNDPITEDPPFDPTEDLLLDREDWEIAFRPFEGNTSAALRMAFNVATLRQELASLLFAPRTVMNALDLAMEVLFPYTSFHGVSFDLFMRLLDGDLTHEEEQVLNALGIKF